MPGNIIRGNKNINSDNAKLRAEFEFSITTSRLKDFNNSPSMAPLKTAMMNMNQITLRTPERASQPKPRNQTHSSRDKRRGEIATSGIKRSSQPKKIFICQPKLTGGCHSAAY